MTTTTRGWARGSVVVTTIAALTLLSVLLAVDAVLIGLHIQYGAVDRQLSLATDRGYAERFGYVKLVFAAALLIGLYGRVRIPAYFGWAFALLLILLDDAATIHEDVGRRITERFSLQPAFGLRAQDFGELATWAGLGLALVTVAGLAHHRSVHTGRRHSRVLALLFSALMLFAVGADMAHIMLTGQTSYIAGIVEDGGELLVLSAIVTYVIAMVLGSRHRRRAELSTS